MVLDFYEVEDCKNTNVFTESCLKKFQMQFSWFIISRKKNYCMPLLNGCVYEMFELSSDNIPENTKVSIYDGVYPEDRDILLQFLIDSRKNGTSGELKFRVLLPKKGLCWFKISAKKELLP